MKNLFFCTRIGIWIVHIRLTRYYIRPFQYNSCYGAVTTYFDFVLLYQHFNAKSTSKFNNICFGCITIRVKRVLVSCISRFRYSAVYCIGFFSDIGASKTETLLGKYPT